MQNNKLVAQKIYARTRYIGPPPTPGYPLTWDPSTSVVAEFDVVSHFLNVGDPSRHSDEDLPHRLSHIHLYIPDDDCNVSLPDLSSSVMMPRWFTTVSRQSLSLDLAECFPRFPVGKFPFVQPLLGWSRPESGGRREKAYDSSNGCSRPCEGWEGVQAFAASRKRRSARAGWEIEFTWG